MALHPKLWAYFMEDKPKILVYFLLKEMGRRSNKGIGIFNLSIGFTLL